MNSEQLRKFIVIANNNSITKAAEKLNLTQPALSHALSELEDELGCKLFVREKKNFHMTAKGEELYPFAQSVIRILTDGEMTLKSADKIRLAAINICAGFLLSNYPEDKLQNVTLIQMDEIEMPEMLQREQVDVVATDDFFFKNKNIPYLNKLLLCREQLYLIVPLSHHLANKEVISFSDLLNEKICTRADHQSLSSWIKRIEETQNIKFNIALSLDRYTYYQIKNKLPYPRFINKSSLMPNDISREYEPGCKIIKVDGELSSRYIYLWYLTSHKKQLEPIFESLKEFYKKSPQKKPK